MSKKNGEVDKFFQTRGDIHDIALTMWDNGFMPLPLEPLSNVMYISHWPTLSEKRAPYKEV